MKNIFCLGLICSGFLMSCAPAHHHKDPPESPVQPQPKVMTACEKRERRFESGQFQLYVEKPVHVSIRRARQNTLYYNCQGQFVRDRLDTVQIPRADIELQPFFKPGAVKAVEVFNADSCNHFALTLPLWDVPLLGSLFPVTGDSKAQIKIKADIAPATFTFQVRPGLNRIYYAYYENCLPRDVEAPYTGDTCDQPGRVYSGIYNVVVDYTETVIPGNREIRPDCSEPRR